ncbi:MAG: FtsK/SpoIIIE domain-containing protein, partial [Ilumatobacteraceae bacterium]
PHAVMALLRSLVVQIATTLGPADVQIVVVSDDARGWDWASWLPHVRSALGDALVIGTHELDRLADIDATAVPLDDRRIVLIVDAPSALTVRTGPLRRFVGSDRVSTIVGCAAGASVPSVCRRVLTIGSTGRAEWSGPRRDDDPTVDHVLIAGLGEPVARRVALALAALADPEDVTESVSGTAATLAFSTLHPEVLGRGVAGIVETWQAGGDDPRPAVVVGASADGVVELDLDRDGPHALIAGTTGSGKSELLRTMVVGLAARVSPAHLQFVLVDYKGGATFDGCRTLPHTVGAVTDLDGGLAERALVSLEAELTRRERLFRAAGAADLREYRTRDRPPLARLVVMIDEFATMTQDVPGFLPALVGIAQRGRSLGVHLVLATQRPAGVVNDDIRANTNLRLALRVNDRADGIDVVGDALPATFPRQRPGRCAVRLGHDELAVFQAASTAGPPPDGRRVLSVRRWPSGPYGAPGPSGSTTLAPGGDELSALVDAIRRAAEQTGFVADGSVWLEPLPALLDASAVAECVAHAGDQTRDVVGLIDDPANQTRRPLRWDVAAGNLVLVGAIGSGVTSTVVSLAAAACRTWSPDDLHVYVIDGHGDRSLDGLAQIAHCGGVIRLGDGQRVDRLLRRLDAEIDRRAVDRNDADPMILLLIDGVGALRRSLDTIDRLALLALLDRILEAGPAARITTCCSTDGTTVCAPIPAADQWVFRVDEHAAAHRAAHRAADLGGGRAVAVNRPPGRLRVMSSGLDAQVALAADGLANLPSRTPDVGPRAIEILPTWVDPAALPASEHRSEAGRSVRRLVLGLRADDLEPATLEVPAGDHIFIGGAGRTGTSTVLAQVAAAWRSLEGDRSVVELPRDRRGWTDELAAAEHGHGGRVLVVVDDADRIDDTDGTIATILRQCNGGVTIAAAARLDAVRSAYGHWTREIARCRCGVIMTAPGEVDGDLLGVVLPRRTLIPARAGLGWIIDGRGHRLVQFAGRLPA